jgi:hypothetical protein
MGVRKTIDWDRVNELLEKQCSGLQIAAHLGLDEDTLYNRCKSDKQHTWSDYASKMKSSGHVILREKQWDLAMQGDKTMLIFLGKQYLDQSEKQKIDTTGIPQTINVTFE